MGAIVSKRWLLARMFEPDIVIVDCRFQLGEREAGYEAYLEAHIPGAVYLDLERDLSGPVGPFGGRQPLPDRDAFVQTVRKAGIGNDSRVVAYDDQGGAMAARFWWMLRYLGHEAVFVLDEGFQSWQEAGFPVTADRKVVVPAYFEPRLRPDLVADVAQVQAKLHQQGVVLIDSREAPRYRGETEPIDAVAGHIPGAVNLFWKDNIAADGTWKSADQLRERFAVYAEGAEEFIVYCGSGVTACSNVLALTEAGFNSVKLYAGSWSDWISYADNQIATGEE
ncbi:sulfurtransferase [Paenibacillus cymbidii]|uniref:sulfurtransferase n=1 Tax=Paenibacillus cymbidii TaxID=1639034 RepID=UPI001081809B|nr:sulfurtransferase [Paenibacillus cymbidii]